MEGIKVSLDEVMSRRTPKSVHSNKTIKKNYEFLKQFRDSGDDCWKVVCSSGNTAVYKNLVLAIWRYKEEMTGIDVYTDVYWEETYLIRK